MPNPAQKRTGTSRPFSFNLTSSQAHRISIEGKPAGHLSPSLEQLGHLPGGGLRSSEMPHEGYADPVMNDRPRFRSNIPISELTERDTRAIEASGVSSTPPIAKTTDGVMITKTNQPSTGDPLRVGARGKLDSQGDRMRGRSTIDQILGRGYVRKTKDNISKTRDAFFY